MSQSFPSQQAAGLPELVCCYSLHCPRPPMKVCAVALVRVGDRMFEVSELCGGPDIKVLLISALTVNYGFLPY